ncbi:MAG TPA: tripartite tricarboxylate transporter substrate-binding protein [Burkholderiaceae bacterium]
MLSAPKGTPPDVLQVLESALRKSMEDPATIGRLTQADVQPSFVGAKDAQAWLQEDVRKFSKIIRDAGLAIQ